MRPRRWLREEGGAVGIMAAVGGALVCVIAGIVIDTASVAYESRRYQGAADLAALAAAANLSQAQSFAETTARANVPSAVTVVSSTGVYDPNPSLAPAQRFSTTVPVGGTANAARVTVTGRAPLYFGRLILGRETTEVSRTGLAALPRRDPMASFSIGSRLARLDGGLANQVLSAVTGSSVQLSVMDYNGLADADINLLSFTDALALKAGLNVGDYDGLLDADVKAGDVLKIVQDLTDGADSGLQKLVLAAGDLNLKIGDLIGTDLASTDGIRGALNANVSALDLATTVLEIAGGDRQARLETGVHAGLADVDVWLAIGERPNRSPWLAISRMGEPIIRTAQTRLYLEARTATALAGLAQVRLPVLVELASSEAHLTNIRCGAAPQVTLSVRPGVARARIGSIDTTKLNDFKHPLTVQPAVLVSVLGLLTITGAADIEAAPVSPTAVVFDQQAITNQTVKTVRSTGFVSGTVSSLVSRLTLSLNGLDLGGILGLVKPLLVAISPVLDGLVDGLLEVLGLSVGEADVVVHGLSCGSTPTTPVLVG